MAGAKPTTVRPLDRAGRPKVQTVWWVIAVWAAFNAGFSGSLALALRNFCADVMCRKGVQNDRRKGAH
jgi:hypothetical protein